MKTLTAATLALCLAFPAMARVEGYGPMRYNRVGRGGWHGGGFVVDRRGGPGWAGVVAGGILGAAAGLALGATVAPAPVYVAPPVVGSMVPVLPEGCVTVPNYYRGAVYNCGNIFYQPVYQGTSLMYEVVPAP